MLVKYNVPYEVTALGKDASSGKRVSSIHYYASLPVIPAPDYGMPVPGDATLDVFLANFIARYETNILDHVGEDLEMIEYTAKSIDGFGYATRLQPIASITKFSPTVTLITVAGLHGFVNNQQVVISGVGINFPGINQSWVITVLTPSTFTIEYAMGDAVFHGGGTVQKIGNRLTWTYGDKLTVAADSMGGISTDALPFFANITVKRNATKAGRNFRSKFSITPVPEADNENGSLADASVTAWQGRITTFSGNILASPPDGDNRLMTPCAVSRQVASSKVSPFTESDTWASGIQTMTIHARLGSVVKRKPKLA